LRHTKIDFFNNLEHPLKEQAEKISLDSLSGKP
jgi:hypothetical protein